MPGSTAGSVPVTAATDIEGSPHQAIRPVIFEDLDTSELEMAVSIEHMSTPAPDLAEWMSAFESKPEIIVPADPDNLQHYLVKMQHFEQPHLEDVFLSADKSAVLVSTFKRMDRVQQLVGHGNFNVISLDEMIRFSRRYDSIGPFAEAELSFLDELFHDSAPRYGFYGEKVINDLTSSVPEKDRMKVSGTGHFLFRGGPEKLFNQVRRDVGEDMILTSGIRSVVKQTHLFLAKTIQAKGNLSRASRSLAPPGHSFHGVGDFDVGQSGYGTRNFSNEFSGSEVAKRLIELGYVDMRYPMDNLLGVRYEPWHIKVV